MSNIRRRLDRFERSVLTSADPEAERATFQENVRSILAEYSTEELSHATDAWTGGYDPALLTERESGLFLGVEGGRYAGYSFAELRHIQMAGEGQHPSESLTAHERGLYDTQRREGRFTQFGPHWDGGYFTNGRHNRELREEAQAAFERWKRDHA